MSIWQVIYDGRVVYESEFKSMAVVFGEKHFPGEYEIHLSYKVVK